MTRPSTGFSTLSVHAGHEAAEPPGHGVRAHMPPLFLTSAFTFSDAEEAVEAFQTGGDYIYTRKGNPTIRALERQVAALESHPSGAGAPSGSDEVDARFFASGMAAISGLSLGLAAGGRMVCQDGIYGTTVTMASMLRRYGVQVDFVPPGDLVALRTAVQEGEPPALVYIESPANPLLQVTDIRETAEIAHAAGARLAVDATFATPALQRPLAWGADFSVHSTTKFMSGHGVVLGGVISGARSLLEERLDPVRQNFGGVADPMAAWLTALGLRTLAVRMDRHSANAARLASSLADHSRVARVYRADPDRLPAGQLEGTSPMLSFEVDGGAGAALKVIDALRVATLAPTLGTLDTLVQHPYSMSHSVLPKARREALGITPGIVRVSVGLEDIADLQEDFARALEE